MRIPQPSLPRYCAILFWSHKRHEAKISRQSECSLAVKRGGRCAVDSASANNMCTDLETGGGACWTFLVSSLRGRTPEKVGEGPFGLTLDGRNG